MNFGTAGMFASGSSKTAGAEVCRMTPTLNGASRPRRRCARNRTYSWGRSPLGNAVLTEVTRMSLNLEQKKAVVAEGTQQLKVAQAAMLAEYRGLTVAQMTQLRRKAHESKVYLRVVKNTLARRATAGTSYECLKDQMTGPLAYADRKSTR